MKALHDLTIKLDTTLQHTTESIKDRGYEYSYGYLQAQLQETNAILKALLTLSK
jgi:hypothetical protein